MISNEKSYLLCLLIAGCISSCLKPPCECDFQELHYVECRIINSQGQNLIFGPGALYPMDSIEILNSYYDHSINNASVRKGLIDSSALRFDFYTPESRSFIYFNRQTKIDTLDLRWVEKKGRCCGGPTTYQSIDEVRFNGILVQPKDGIYSFVK